jgi:ribosome-binding protein aMBF1 (putative translation factor)
MASAEDWTKVTIVKAKPRGAVAHSAGPIGAQPVIVGGQRVSLSKDEVSTVARSSSNKGARPAGNLYRTLDSSEAVDQKAVLPTFSKTLGQKISRVRAEKGLSRKQLAGQISETEGVLGGVERGDSVFKQPLLTKINRALGTSFTRAD